MNETKILALYLPQFHEIEENNNWWGKGFTEWINVKKAQQLYKWHNQPRIPLNNNYYDLSDVETLKWQTQIAKEHGIYGFCYYNYYFEGRKLLEKPLEILLANKDIDFPFCISWANHSWTRTWGGPGKNEMLLKQTYGTEKQWKEHFEYLLEYFLDERYIKINNKPIFIIYNTSEIKDIDAMLKLWNSLALENGFQGIHIIETINSFQKKSYTKYGNGLMYFEPLYTFAYNLSFFKKLKLVINKFSEKILNKTFFLIIFKYDSIWKKILSRKVEKKSYLCGFVDWDNSARKGRRAYISEGTSPEKFKKYFQELIEKSSKLENHGLIFINAWNEWAEGTYLEPDTKHNFGYLEAIKDIMTNNKNND